MENISWTTLTFLKKFTPTELLTIKQSTVPQVEYFLLMCLAAERVISDNTLTIQGMDLLVSKGLITEQRKNGILNS